MKMANVTPRSQSQPYCHSSNSSKKQGNILIRKLSKKLPLHCQTLAKVFHHKEKLTSENTLNSLFVMLSGNVLIRSPLPLVKKKVLKIAHEAKKKVSETTREAEEKVSEIAHGAKEKLATPKKWMSHEAKDKVARTAYQTKKAVGNVLGKAKEGVVQKGQDSIDKAKDIAKIAKDTTKIVREHIVGNITEQAEKVRQKAMAEARKEKKVKTSANKFFDGLKYMTLMEVLNSVMGMANLLGLVTAYGMNVWVTFISSSILFRVVQSKIYPIYFKAMAYSIGLALLGHILGQRKILFSSKPEMFQAYNLLSSLLMVMFEKMKLEKEKSSGRDHDFVAKGSRATKPPPSVTEPTATKTRRLSFQQHPPVQNRKWLSQEWLG
ncbi:protein of unknown function DUF4149 - like 2 [Theobroma cacao]|nr:protein of unknown function DUF4149 - like 2 [Theobroma cacao]